MQATLLTEKRYKAISEILYLAGFRYWIASLLPALVGSTLPFWLRPTGFTFKWFTAVEFLIATVLFHTGFSFLDYFFGNKFQTILSRLKLSIVGFTCILIACLIGIHLNSDLVLHKGVPSFIFIAFGIATVFVGFLYVAPPFSFNKRIGGEVIIAEGLGMLPVIGAYVVQVGDITRTVYIASLPIVVATFLWIWIIEIIQKNDGVIKNKNNLVIYFGVNFASRIGVAIIVILFFLTALFAVISSSINSLFIIILLFVLLGWKIISNSWQNYLIPVKMKRIEKKVMQLHLATCSIIILSSLLNFK